MKIVSRILLLFLAACLLASCSEPKAYHYRVTGTVVDESNAPLEGVKVVLSGFDLERVRSLDTVTDADGDFLLNFDINPFEWRQEAHWVFHLSKDGYVSRYLTYPEFSYDDRFRYQGYWYKVFFRGPAMLKTQDTPAETPQPANPAQ